MGDSANLRVNAFQRQLEQQDTMFSDAKAVDLVWQAARLRIFELAQVMPLSEAIDHVKNPFRCRIYSRAKPSAAVCNFELRSPPR